MGYFLVELFQLQLRDYLFIYNPIDTFMKPISIVLFLFIFLMPAILSNRSCWHETIVL